MVEEPKPDWFYKFVMVGDRDGTPILVTVDELGQLAGGLGAYIDRYIQTVYRTSTGADLNHDSLAVDAGEKFIITHLSFWHDDPIPRRLSIYFQESTTGHTLYNAPFLLQYEVFDRQGLWVLKEDDFIRAVLVTPASGKHGSLSLNGYKVEDTS